MCVMLVGWSTVQCPRGKRPQLIEVALLSGLSGWLRDHDLSSYPVATVVS